MPPPDPSAPVPAPPVRPAPPAGDGLARLATLARRPAPTGLRAEFVHGLLQLPLGLHLVLREPALRRIAAGPALVVAAICALAVLVEGGAGGPLGWATTFVLTLAAIASMPPLLMGRSYARLAAATHLRLGFGPCLPHRRTLRALIAESVSQALLLAIGLLPVVLLVGEVSTVGGALALGLGGAWTLHWIVVEALEAARTDRPDGARPAAAPPGALPWFARLYQVPPRGPLRLLAPVRVFGRLVARLGRRWREEVALIEARPALAVGFSLGVALVLVLPVVNLLLRPAVIAAAVHVRGQLGARDGA